MLRYRVSFVDFFARHLFWAANHCLKICLIIVKGGHDMSRDLVVCHTIDGLEGILGEECLL